jgi:uncharacterized membrane protein
MNAPDLERLGRLMLALGMAGLGALGLVFGDFAPGLQPPLAFLGSGTELAYALNGLLLIAALAMFGKPGIAHPAALAVAALWAFWIALGHLPKVWAERGDVVAWVSLAEVAGAAAVAWLLSTDHPSPRQRWTARVIVGLMLVWFGVVHIQYRSAIAGMIPEWMPLRDVWPFVTGAANIAAGLGIVTGVLGRLGAALVGLMFASWIFLVHVPRLIGAPSSREEWTALALNLVLVGCVWGISAMGFRREA